MHGCVTDNGRHKLSDLNFGQDDSNALSGIADRSIESLCKENADLLVFPHCLYVCEDDIKSESVCSIRGDELITGNIMGFIGAGDMQLDIRSRFTGGGPEDYFLHYMLQRVFAPNLFDLKHTSSNDPVLNFSMYLFPYFLKKAVGQGIFKQYRRRRYNDADIRGTIDVARHIACNMPFNGRIAYNAREYVYDNPVTQLVRHTIEYIRDDSTAGDMLKCDAEAALCANRICAATPSYERRDRSSVIASNLRPARHPYYTEYAVLQKLCLHILCRKGLKYGNNRDKIYGLLFDGAWLWEEYLNTVLRDTGLIHARNKCRRNPLYLFAADRSYPRYPDFYERGRQILDAKYKGLTDGRIGRDDIHQLISYMYIERATEGGLIYPRTAQDNVRQNIGTLNGYGGSIVLYGFAVPQKATGFADFRRLIAISETALSDSIRKRTSL